MEKRICEICGKDISLLRKGRVRCERKACDLEHRRREREKDMIVCEYCGKLFTPHDDEQVVCKRPACRKRTREEAVKVIKVRRDLKPLEPEEDVCFSQEIYEREQAEMLKHPKVCTRCGGTFVGPNIRLCPDCQGYNERISTTFRTDGYWGGGEDKSHRAFSGVM